MREIAFIGLGANLNHPVAQIERALAAIAALPHTDLLRRSGFYGSRPMGPADQPDYVNAVAQVETRLPPEDLLTALLAIERRHGRERSPAQRNGPRTLDLDLLLHGDVVRADPALTLPHPGAHERDFVLVPLAEIAPDLIIPGRGAVRDLLAVCIGHGVRCLTSVAPAALAG